MSTLHFEKRDKENWYAGIYHIARYDRDSRNYGRTTYGAYHIRKGETMSGYYVDQSTPFYTRLADAQKACKQHAKTY